MRWRADHKTGAVSHRRRGVPGPSGRAVSDAELEAGFNALQQSDGDTAAAVFRRALGAEPDNPVALYGAGVAAHLQGRAGEAIEFLKRALRAEPRLTQASALLGDLVYHQGDLNQAIKTYEAALAHAPSSVLLRERLAAWRSEADVHGGLVAFKDDRFAIHFNGPANQQLAARASAVLREAFWRIGASAAQADLAYEISAFATSALLTRIAPANLGVLLQDLERGQTVDIAVQRFGFTFAEFERGLAQRVGARLPVR